jgi:hypothetical protein
MADGTNAAFPAATANGTLEFPLSERNTQNANVLESFETSNGFIANLLLIKNIR